MLLLYMLLLAPVCILAALLFDNDADVAAALGMAVNDVSTLLLLSMLLFLLLFKLLLLVLLLLLWVWLLLLLL